MNGWIGRFMYVEVSYSFFWRNWLGINDRFYMYIIVFFCIFKRNIFYKLLEYDMLYFFFIYIIICMYFLKIYFY